MPACQPTGSFDQGKGSRHPIQHKRPSFPLLLLIDIACTSLTVSRPGSCALPRKPQGGHLSPSSSYCIGNSTSNTLAGAILFEATRLRAPPWRLLSAIPVPCSPAGCFPPLAPSLHFFPGVFLWALSMTPVMEPWPVVLDRRDFLAHLSRGT